MMTRWMTMLRSPEAGDAGGGSAATGDGNANGGGSTAGDGQPELIQLTPDALGKRLERERKATETATLQKLRDSGVIVDDPAQLEEFRKWRESAGAGQQQGDDKLKAVNDTLTKLREQLAAKDAEVRTTAERAKAEVQEAKIGKEVALAMGKMRLADGVKPAQVEYLLKAGAKFGVDSETGDVTVLDEKGNEIYSRDPARSGQPMSVAEYVEQTMRSDMAWALAPERAGGAGASAGRGGRNASLPQNWEAPGVYQTLSPEQKELARAQYLGTSNSGGGFTMARPKKT